MDPAAALIVADALGFILTRIPCTLHGTTHIPLSPTERDQLGKAVAMVAERRMQIVLEAGDDLLALGTVLGMAFLTREMAARQEEAERKKAQAAAAAAERMAA